LKISGHLAVRLHILWQRKGLVSALLLPFSWLTRLAIALRQYHYRRHPEKVGHSRHPVVVVGNLYVGGTGKTPVVIALTQAMQERGWRPGIISRGYGARVGDLALAGQGNLDPTRFGDEPVLIAAATGVPLAVHPQRILALRELEQSFPEVDLVIADDGLQHLGLGRDIEIVVQDERGLGNGRILPAGPLREPPAKLAEVDFLITNLGSYQRSNRPTPAPLHTHARELAMRLRPAEVTHLISKTSLEWAQWQTRYSGVSVSAVAGIGHPERFFSMLNAAGLQLDHTLALPDHYPYERSPFNGIPSDIILITAKDAVKCARFAEDRLWVVRPAIEFSDNTWLDDLHGSLKAIARKKSA